MNNINYLKRMLVWQTFPPVLKFAFGYTPVMDISAGVGVGGIHILGSQGAHSGAHTYTQTTDGVSFITTSTTLHVPFINHLLSLSGLTLFKD